MPFHGGAPLPWFVSDDDVLSQSFAFTTSYPGGQRAVVADVAYPHAWNFVSTADEYIGQTLGWVDGSGVGAPRITVPSLMLGSFASLTITASTSHVMNASASTPYPAQSTTGGQSAYVRVEIDRGGSLIATPAFDWIYYDVDTGDIVQALGPFTLMAGDVFAIYSIFEDEHWNFVNGYDAPVGGGGPADIPASSAPFTITIEGTR